MQVDNNTHSLLLIHAGIIIGIVYAQRSNLIINKGSLPRDPIEDFELYPIDGNSWRLYPCKNYSIIFAIDLDQMTRSPQGGREYCGMEALVRYPKTNKTLKMYVGDAFDPKWVKTPGSIDIIVESFKYLTNDAPLRKNVIFGIEWEFTGNKSAKYSYASKGDI